jgi:hypothetical protein
VRTIGQCCYVLKDAHSPRMRTAKNGVCSMVRGYFLNYRHVRQIWCNVSARQLTNVKSNVVNILQTAASAGARMLIGASHVVRRPGEGVSTQDIAGDAWRTGVERVLDERVQECIRPGQLLECERPRLMSENFTCQSPFGVAQNNIPC